jgi:hypothetical protein
MPRLSAVEAISPAFERLKAMMFRPFRLKTWFKVGLIGLLAGGMASSGNFNFKLPSAPSQLPSGSGKSVEDFIRSLHLANYLPLIAVLAVIALVITVAFIYLSCRFRFVLFDSVLASDPNIERGWRRYGRQAHRYLGFWLVYTIIAWSALFFIVALPLWQAYTHGIFQSDDFLAAFFRLLLPIVLGMLLFAVVSAIVTSLANDFLVPMLALDDLPLGRAWARLKTAISAEPGAWAGYLGMKLLLTIAAGIITSMAAFAVGFLCLLVLLIPGIVIGLLVAAIVKATGPVGVALAVVAVLIGIAVLVALFLTLGLLATAPNAVFFTAYSFYFFGGRYPKLGAILWPEPPPPVLPPPAAATVPTTP